MGYRFSPQFADNLLAKYNAKGRRLTLDNFILACVQGQSNDLSQAKHFIFQIGSLFVELKTVT
jgi:hypothetical protein